MDAHLLAQLGVQVGQRFVEQQYIGADRQRAGERHPLLLTTGEFARQALAQAFEAYEPQRLLDPRRDLAGQQLAHLQPERDVARHGQVRKQCVALEHQAGIALPWRQLGDVAAIEANCTRARRYEAGDHAQGRGLAAARRPEQHEEFAVLDGKAHLAHGMDLAIAAREPVELEACHQTTRASLT
jgi:hypothetical protein